MILVPDSTVAAMKEKLCKEQYLMSCQTLACCDHRILISIVTKSFF